MSIHNKRKRNRVILILIILTLVIGFVGLLIRSPERGNAFNELSKCTNEIEVQKVWETYADQQFNDLDFENKTREKLSSFNLSLVKINACLNWLPPTPTHLNLIVIPDLSNRISNPNEFPGQYDRDLVIMRTIWKTFVAFVGTRESKHQMAITPTYNTNVNSGLSKNVNNLFADMNGKVNNPQHIFFTPYRTTKFNSNSREIYEYAFDNPIASDFYTFFKSDLESFLKSPTLYDNYKNKLIIITDGKIINDMGGGATEITKYKEKFMSASNKDSLIRCITDNGLNLRPVEIDWTNTETLICEISGGTSNSGFYTEVLSAYWEDWFSKMNCPIKTLKSSRPEQMVCNQIKVFIEQ
ncbi:MAG: hypothetical protein ACI8ZM_001801 [Crocinitomix sp.]|jgi:hypothetical protein